MRPSLLRALDHVSAAFFLVSVGFLTLFVPDVRAAPLGKPGLAGGNPDLSKVSSHLLVASQEARRGLSLKTIGGRDTTLELHAGGVRVEVWLRGLTPSILEAMKRAGLEVRHSSVRYGRATGFLPLEDLRAVAAIPEVLVVEPFYGAVAAAGAVDDQADVTMRADLARSTYGVDGSGLKIGILSDSFDDRIGGTLSGNGCYRTLTGSAPQTTGDLPPAVTVLDNGPRGVTDEGAAMGELVHDLAPGAQILFHSAFNSEADFAQGITDLRSCGADVIVGDTMYYEEPMFQDGIIASSAQDAVDAGVPYFSAAGNQARFGVDQTYVDSDTATDDQIFPADGSDFHAFPGGSDFAAFTLPPHCGVRFVLEWNQPFSGVSGPGSGVDLDLYSCTAQSASSCAPIAFDRQGCSSGSRSGNPLEIGDVVNSGSSPLTRYLAVDRYCGNKAGLRFRIAVYGLRCGLARGYSFDPGVFDAPQIYGHPAARGVVATGAVFYGEADSGGNYTAPPRVINVEPFSSLGGELPFYFDPSGLPLSSEPVYRFKPELVAPDGTNTTFFGRDIPYDSDTHPNFFGTSAAAPHAAAAALLIKEISPSISPRGVEQVLEAGSRDVESPGVDDLSGFGLVDAFNAVSTVSPGSVACVEHLSLSGQVIGGDEFFRACQSIVIGPGVSVASGAELTLRAKNIELEPGVSILGALSAGAKVKSPRH